MMKIQYIKHKTKKDDSTGEELQRTNLLLLNTLTDDNVNRVKIRLLRGLFFFLCRCCCRRLTVSCAPASGHIHALRSQAVRSGLKKQAERQARSRKSLKLATQTHLRPSVVVVEGTAPAKVQRNSIFFCFLQQQPLPSPSSLLSRFLAPLSLINTDYFTFVLCA